MKKQVILALGCLLVAPAHAGPFKKALKEKKVCEAADGFIQPTSGHEEEMNDLVAKVNSKRKAVYEKIASKEGTPVDAVALEHADEQSPANRCR